MLGGLWLRRSNNTKLGTESDIITHDMAAGKASTQGGADIHAFKRRHETSDMPLRAQWHDWLGR